MMHVYPVGDLEEHETGGSTHCKRAPRLDYDGAEIW